MYFNIKQLKIILNVLVKYNTNKAREVCKQTSKMKVHYRVTPTMKEKEVTVCPKQFARSSGNHLVMGYLVTSERE